jgi:Amt family ammonium transporter
MMGIPFGNESVFFIKKKGLRPEGADGLIYGNFALLKAHLISTCATALYAAIVTFVILKIMSFVMNIRVTANQEAEGLDISLHGEEAYSGFNR